MKLKELTPCLCGNFHNSRLHDDKTKAVGTRYIMHDNMRQSHTAERKDCINSEKSFRK